MASMRKILDSSTQPDSSVTPKDPITVTITKVGDDHQHTDDLSDLQVLEEDMKRYEEERRLGNKREGNHHKAEAAVSTQYPAAADQEAAVVDDDAAHPDTQSDSAKLSAQTETSNQAKGRAPVRPTSPMSTIDPFPPTKLNKGKGRDLLQTKPPAVTALLPSKVVFQVSGNASMTDKDAVNTASTSSNRKDASGSGIENTRAPTTTAPACTTQTHSTGIRRRRISDATLRRQEGTNGPRALPPR
ncbi:hypothetical protein SLS60_005909 [Paraconiothyrium brasiliense]|uniref:Uncharacterized protein n=1 Tax=Paraconiothyrium brasiliense TaxID=300254 RepID=A0ABR3RDW4_9PLEO